MAVAAVVLFAVSSAADAATLRFTATSANFGELGWLEMDDSVFDGSSSQLVQNTNILDLRFINPNSGLQFHIGDVVGTNRTVFDSSTSTPALIGGSGILADVGPLLSIGCCNFVHVGEDFLDVTWSTATVSPVPLPPAALLFAAGLAGLGGMSWLRRRRPTPEFAAA